MAATIREMLDKVAVEKGLLTTDGGEGRDPAAAGRRGAPSRPVPAAGGPHRRVGGVCEDVRERRHLQLDLGLGDHAVLLVEPRDAQSAPEPLPDSSSSPM